MRYILWLLGCAGALSLAACNRDQPAATDAAVNLKPDTAVVIDNDDMRQTTAQNEPARTEADLTVYQDEGNRVADQVTADLGITDTAQIRRVRGAYYTRARRLGELESRYATDTAGRYAAVRQVDADTDRELRTIVTDENRYRTYETNRPRYYGSAGSYAGGEAAPAATAVSATGTSRTAPASQPRRRGPAIVKYKREGGETKIEYANGKKVKIDEDGDRKVEYPNGVKVKRDADDGRVKIKD